MKVILIKDVENLGLKYDIIDVKPGYARNFLIPNNLASLATPNKRKELKKQLEEKTKEEQEIIKEAENLIEKLKTTNLIIEVKTKFENKIFGSLNNKNISESLFKLGIKIDKKHIKILGNSIKKIGKYTAKIRLHRLVEYEYKFEVIEKK